MQNSYRARFNIAGNYWFSMNRDKKKPKADAMGFSISKLKINKQE